MIQNSIAIEGKRYGRLTVLREVDCPGKERRYLCKCDCGGEKVVTRNCLVTGRTKSCGCMRHGPAPTIYPMDPGTRFGRLVIIGPAPRRNGRTMYFCKCDCGTEKAVAKRDLIHGDTKSCGCLRGITGSIVGQSNKGRQIEKRYKYYYNGIPLKVWAAEHGICINTLTHRISRGGMSVEQAVETPIIHRRRKSACTNSGTATQN